MASAVDICNLALGMLGDDATVSSISPPEGSAQAEHCARFYPIARSALLEMYPWRFATRRVALAEVDNPLDSWPYAYGLPSDCVKPLAVLLPEATDDDLGQAFTVEADSNGSAVLYTGVEEAVLRYLVSVSDTTKFTPLFVNACARLLASYLAGPIIKGTEGMKVSQAQLQTFYKFEYPLAAASDANAAQTDSYKDYNPSSIAARA